MARLGQKRGWHRDELGLSDGKHLNHTEKNQLLVEVLLLEQFIAGLGPSRKNEIWLAAEQVWHDLPSSKIASGYVQAFCIAKKVVEAQGDNGFLGASGLIHVRISKDFDETATGLCCKDDKVLKAP